MIRTIVAAMLLWLSLGAAAPVAALSLVHLEPNEREAMLSTCGRLHGNDQSLCRDVVNDSRVIANYKRSCLHAMTLLLHGTAWARVKSLPPTVTCHEGLKRAGYPVGDIMRRLAGGK